MTKQNLHSKRIDGLLKEINNTKTQRDNYYEELNKLEKKRNLPNDKRLIVVTIILLIFGIFVMNNYFKIKEFSDVEFPCFKESSYSYSCQGQRPMGMSFVTFKGIEFFDNNNNNTCSFVKHTLKDNCNKRILTTYK